MYAELFSYQAKFLKALAHPRRLEIVQLLRDQELPVTDIHTMLDLPQANISQHLMILREARVVESKQQGKHVLYRLTDKRILQASDLIRELLIDFAQTSELADELTLTMHELLPLVHDPVCHMRLSPKTASFHCIYADKHFYFCASGCLAQFQENPEKYLITSEKHRTGLQLA